MDSDSDLFESADEEFDSDDNEDDSKRPTKNNGNTKDINVTDLVFESLTIKSKVDDSVSTKEHPSKTLERTEMQTNDNEQINTDKHEEIVACENNKCNQGNVDDNITHLNTKIFDENNANTILNETSSTGRPKPRVIDRKERPQRSREPKSKLGVKLGTKISSTKVEVNYDTFEELKKPVIDVSTETKKSEYGVPPRLVSCWEDTMSPQTKQPTEDKSPKLYSEKSDFNPDKNFWDNEADYMELPKEEKKENILPVLDKLADITNKEQSLGGGWGGWSNWGVSSLLSTATLGVSTLTSSVSQGISTVLESGIGVPDPEELARIHKEQKEKMVEQSDKQQEITVDKSLSQENSQIGFGFGNLVSGVTHITKLVEATGTNILTGGLDTLEVIGKKTMEVLQEGDPGLKKKRALLGINEKPVLSQILREAKDKAEEENKFLEEKHIARRPHYETIFDDYQGLVHLEALEMLSKQCDIKLGTLLETYKGSALTDMQETMAQIKELCELPDEDDDSEVNDIETVREKIDSAINDLNIQISYEHFLETWTDIDTWLQDTDTKPNENEVHEKAIESLAQLTAIAVEQFHKAGELLLVKERRSTVDEADSLVQLTITVTGVIGVVAGKFSEQLNSLANGAFSSECVNGLITNIFLEVIHIVH